MEVSRTPAISPLDDPEFRAAQQERLRQLRAELRAEMSDEDRAEADRHYHELLERSKHWPE